MNPLVTALIFVVAMALPAFLVVQYTVKPRRQLALAQSPAHRRLTQSEEGSVVMPFRARQSDAAGANSGLLKAAKPTKEQLASALDHQVEDTIRKLILMS